MSGIRVLDANTIDKIAAGEVIERASSVVKELVENSLDAGAGSISIEIKNGGVDLIRVTDNGSGISPNEVRTAFLPHATSKLRHIEDLGDIESLGFRGEALPSIASVCEVELITKTADSPTAIRYIISGGLETGIEEVGGPDGTTFIVRNLFLHIPARKKFLKTAMTEAGYVSALVEQLALSRPDVAFKYTVNGASKLVTLGNGDLKEVIYRIYGKNIADSLIYVHKSEGDMTLDGYMAKPVVVRSSRAMENYFVNSRYVKDKLISKAIEDAYSGYLMQHKFPFVVLMLNISGQMVDVNVHPRKLEVRFSDSSKVYEFIRAALHSRLEGREFIGSFSIGQANGQKSAPFKAPRGTPEPFERRRAEALSGARRETSLSAPASAVRSTNVAESGREYSAGAIGRPAFESVGSDKDAARAASFVSHAAADTAACGKSSKAESEAQNSAKKEEKQLELFEEKILTKRAAQEFNIVGQIFMTYWIVEYRDRLLIIDQHAAHEKVMYERLMEQLREKEVATQLCSPPSVITLDGSRRALLEQYIEVFRSIGFEIEPFGANDYAMRAVPADLYGLKEADVFISLLDELASGGADAKEEVLRDKIASMSCKAAVKGNSAMSKMEAEQLIGQLLELKDPYNCPHGRPTIIQMSKRELEKKFKRII